MSVAPRLDPRLQAAGGALLLVLLALPPLRPLLEGSMSLHMLVQYPALMLAGAGLCAALSPAAQRRLVPWNAMGLTGLCAAALVLAVLMIPRLLDLALVDLRVEALKFGALLLAGAALRLSWRRAGLLVQGFFLGNVLPMTGTIGWLYEASPLRVCNAYGLVDQQRVGMLLVALAWGIGILWLARLVRLLMRREAQMLARMS